MCSWMSFNKCVHSLNHGNNWDIKCFYHLLHTLPFGFPHLPNPWQSLTCFLSLQNGLLVCRVLYKWHHTVYTLASGFFLLSIMFLRFIYLVACIIVHYFVLLNSIPCYRYIIFVHLFASLWTPPPRLWTIKSKDSVSDCIQVIVADMFIFHR